MALHEELSAESQLHFPKGFAAASNNSAVVKNQVGGIEWFERERLPKAINLVSSIAVPPTEVENDVYLIGAESGTLDVDTIVWQSATTVRYTFNGTPDLSPYAIGDYIIIATSTNTSNNGAFQLTDVNDGSDYIEIDNPLRTDGTDDEATDSPSTATITLEEWDGAPQNSWVRFDGLNWTSITPTVGYLCYLTGSTADYNFNGTTWVASASPSDGNGMFSASNEGGAWGVNNFGTNIGTTTMSLGGNLFKITSSAVDGFSVDGTTFSVDASNNRVGIGAAAPVARLTVLQSAVADPSLSASNNAITVGATGTNSAVRIGIDANFESYIAGGKTNTTASNPLNINPLGGDVSIIPSGTGNVGIGTASPSEKLHVEGSARFSTFVRWNGTNGLLSHDGSGNVSIGAQVGDLKIAANTSGKKVNFNVGGLANALIVGGVDSSFATNLGIGTTSPSEKLHVSGGFRVDAFTTNSVFVDTTKNFVGIRTATQLAGENMRLIGDLRVSSGVSLSTAAVAANTFATAAGGKLKLNAATIKDVSGTMDFETSNNSFLFRDNLSDFNMFKLTDDNVQMQSKDADAGATLRSLNLKIESSYWDGALNWNVATVKNEAQDTSGKHRLLFNIGGADRMTIQSDGVVTIEEFTVATLPADSAGGIIMVTDETGGYTMAFNDGVDWRRVQDRAIVT